MDNPRIKVLHVTQVSGGIQTYIEKILQNLDKERFEIVLACPLSRQSLIDCARQQGVLVHEINLKWHISPFYDILSVFEIVKLVKRERPHLVHAHSSKAGMICRIAGIFLEQKILYTPNAYAYLGATGFKRKLLILIEKLARPLTSLLLASSRSEEKRSLNDIKFPASKVRVFPNSIEEIDIAGFARDKKGTNPTVLTVGRFVKQKNPIHFIEVCKKVVEKQGNICFKMIGGGFDDRLSRQVTDKIEECGVQNNIQLINWMSRDDLLKEIRSCQVFCMTSEFESFGYVAAEAYMLEVPVVSYDVDGLNEIVANNITGYLVKKGDTAGMAEKILSLVNDSDLARKIGKKGRERILKMFNIKGNIHILEDTYEEYGKLTNT